MSDEEEIILSELSNEELVLQMHDDLYDGLNDEIVEGVNILLERRKEFYGEGLRFYDLARTGQDMPLIDSVKQLNDDLTGTPPTFGSYRYAYPISISERNANPNIQQNAGY